MSPRIERAKCWLRARWYGTTIIGMAFCLFLGMFTAMIIGRTEAGEFWLIYGGNTDPGDGQGNGAARDQMIAGGWTDAEHSYQIHWAADIGGGTVNETDDAMAAGHEAYEKNCHKYRCILAGFSLGNSPALQLASETGHPAGDTYLFGAPQPSSGVWHSQYPDNPFIEPWIQAFGRINPDRTTSAGMQAFYDTHDPYANAAPQCSGPGLFALSVNPGHRIIAKGEANQHVWTGVDGVVMHEAGYVAQPGLPLSGADPSPFWAGCLLNDWKTTPASPGDQVSEPGTVGGPPSMPNGLPSFPMPIPTPGG